MRILLVDDDPDLREVMAIVLEADGHEVKQAGDGADALQHLRSGPLPELILLDMMMPQFDGEAFMRMMAEGGFLARVPVVIISGNKTVQEKAKELGALACLVKPIDLEQLSSVVELAQRSRAELRSPSSPE